MSLQDSMKIFVYDVEERAMRLPEANSKEHNGPWCIRQEYPELQKLARGASFCRNLACFAAMFVFLDWPLDFSIR